MSTHNPTIPSTAVRAVWQRDKPLLKSEATRPYLHPGDQAQNVERMQSFRSSSARGSTSAATSLACAICSQAAGCMK